MGKEHFYSDCDRPNTIHYISILLQAPGHTPDASPNRNILHAVRFLLSHSQWTELDEICDEILADFSAPLVPRPFAFRPSDTRRYLVTEGGEHLFHSRSLSAPIHTRSAPFDRILENIRNFSRSSPHSAKYPRRILGAFSATLLFEKAEGYTLDRAARFGPNVVGNSSIIAQTYSRRAGTVEAMKRRRRRGN